LVEFLTTLDERWTVPNTASKQSVKCDASTNVAGISAVGPIHYRVSELMGVVRLVAADGQQRAAQIDWVDPEDMEVARIHIRDQAETEGLNVQPWTWRQATSGGRPLTESGKLLGYELRFSRHKVVAQGG
jgi:hypothetical protein